MSSERIDRLEERLAWFERHVTEQDKVMLELAEDLARLRAELLILRSRGDAGSSELLSGDERPPHY
ncbi:MAG TPA: SlyX family protein [Rariglobus sp.]|jgi:SlyX protein|nr:SlyX family protein [Rariglobus sp.]